MSISDTEVKSLLREFRKKGKDLNTNTWRELAAIAFGEIKRATVRERLVAMKLYAECVITRASESETTVVKNDKPSIYLPERKADPANVVQIKKGITSTDAKRRMVTRS